MHNRTKALAISKSVKEKVAERDSFDGWTCCVLCGYPAPSNNRLAFSNAHYISRAHGGLGIEENILTLCPACHRRYDQSTERAVLKLFLANYLREKYPDWEEPILVFKKEN